MVHMVGRCPKNGPKQDLKLQYRSVDDGGMSNLWKALRDVSRDADPTVGFEPSDRPSGGEAPPAPGATEGSTEAAVDESTATVNRPGAPRPPSPSRRLAEGETTARPRLAPLQSPLRHSRAAYAFCTDS